MPLRGLRPEDVLMPRYFMVAGLLAVWHAHRSILSIGVSVVGYDFSYGPLTDDGKGGLVTTALGHIGPRDGSHFGHLR